MRPEKEQKEKSCKGTGDRDAISVSVRSLVEFLLVSGSIDKKHGFIDPVTSMQEGSRIHKKIQKKAGTSYHAEVPLSFCFDYGEFDLILSGRADGIIYDGELPSDEPSEKECDVIIDEIKGVHLDLEKLEDPIPVHLAQAKCYAFIFAKTNSLSNITVRLTYVNIDTEETKIMENRYSFTELSEWFSDLMESFRRFASFRISWKKKRDRSLHEMTFPFEYREGQRKLISEIYYSIREGKTLFLQAPTGTGKTLSTLYPSMKSQGEGLSDTIFYLTAKNATRAVCEDALSLLREKGLFEKSLTISAREKACLNGECICTPEDCPFANGHFDRILDALYDILTNEDAFQSSVIKDYATRHRVCPYYLSLELSDWSDIVICDYNYVFDPVVALKRFFGEGKKGDHIFLMDEAHNLVERGRDMYSAALSRNDILLAKRIVKKESFGLKRTLTRVNNIMKEWEEKTVRVFYPDLQETNDNEKLIFALMNLLSALEKNLDENVFPEDEDELRELFFNIRFFLSMYEYKSDGYVLYCVKEEGGRIRIILFCVDPSGQLSERLNYGRSSVFFSATLLPMKYYRDILCREETPYAAFARSSFDQKKLGVFSGKDVSSLYRQRDESMYMKYADYLSRIVSVKKGNYMAFFPSYSFMEEVEKSLSHFFLPEDIRIVVQSKDMNEEERREFLANFSDNEKNTLGLTVMGGAFSEGIDLKGEKLIGAVIIGVALPKVSVRQDIIKDYFEGKGMDGFSYAYLYPGMTKVLQAAGRVIRTEEDEGIVVLLDQRFSIRDYTEVFPESWSDIKYGTIDTLCVDIKDFWDKCT